MALSSFAFRTIETPGAQHRSEQLFRASVSAFCSLTRPSKAETAQFRELATALFDKVSGEAKRFASATLSDLSAAPVELVQLLASQPIDIAAPLLARSPLLKPSDFVRIVERHGADHARAIARRSDIDPSIRALLELFVERAQTVAQSDATTKEDSQTAVPKPEKAAPEPGMAAEAVRAQLRAAVTTKPAVPAPERQPVPDAPRAVLVSRLRPTALAGNRAFFQTALADALGVRFAVAGTIITAPGYSSLLTALRGIGLRVEDAFLIVAAVYPDQFTSTDSIRLFVERYRLLSVDAALDRIDDWLAQADAEATGGNAANDAGRAVTGIEAMPLRRAG